MISKRNKAYVLGLMAIALLVTAITADPMTKAINALQLFRNEGPRAVVRRILGMPNMPWPEVASSPFRFDRGQPFSSFATELSSKSTRAFLVVKDGTLIHEWYANDYGANSLFGLASAAKGMIGAFAFMLALDDSLIALGDPVYNYVPAWKADSLKSRVTLGQLVTHTAGLEDVAFATQYSGWKQEYLEDPNRRFRMAIDRPRILREPGTVQAYSGIGYYLLAYSLTASLQGNSSPNIEGFLENRLFRPLQIPRAAWSISYGEAYELDQLELYAIGSGASLTARAAALLGQLLLNRGDWHGTALIGGESLDLLFSYRGLPPERRIGRMDMDTDGFPSDKVMGETVAQPVPATGIGWWMNLDGFFPSLPKDAIVAAGAGHNVVLVVPSEALVVVRFGGALNGDVPFGPQFWHDLDEHLFSPLMEAATRSGLTGRVKAP